MLNRRDLMLSSFSAAIAAVAMVSTTSPVQAAWREYLESDEPRTHEPAPKPIFNGKLYHGNREVGWWEQHVGGTFSYKIFADNDSLKGSGASLTTFFWVLDVWQVRPYRDGKA